MEIHDWVLMPVIMVVVVVLIIYVAKIILLQKQLQHEETIKKLDFMQKKEWEQFLFERQDSLAKKEEQKKQKEQSNGETNVSQERSITAKQTDINRNVLLHLILSNKEENLTADKLEKELENIKKSYKIIEQYIND